MNNYKYELAEQVRQEEVAQIMQDIAERKRKLKKFLKLQRKIRTNKSLQRLLPTESVHPDTSIWMIT